ncbi:MAG: flavin monoamine oxidase family protein [Myxococcota bacterium]
MDSEGPFISRRSWLKTVIAGAVAAGPLGCPHGGERSAKREGAPPATPSAKPEAPTGTKVSGENFSHPHQKRDGIEFPRAAPRESCEVAVIGGGPSGLCALHLLQKRDAVLLEKEDRFGGNCSSDSWEGIDFSTGAAFYSEGDHELVELLNSIGAKGLPIIGGDALIVNGAPYFDFFGDGAKLLPFSQAVRDDFRRSRDDANALHSREGSAALDSRPFSDLLRDRSPELKKFWDRFGASNWGAASEHTSARLGVQAYAWLSGGEKRLTFPGGLGHAARALATALESKLAGRLRKGVFVHHVEPEPGKRGGVLVHTLENGEPRTLRARAVILAVPKFFAARIVPSLSDAQRAAMTAYRYAPYPVFNVCLNGRGPAPAYDNWFLDEPFADFIPADWVLNAGKPAGPGKSALTVYHPLPEARRSELLDEALLVQMAERVVLGLDRHFPGLRGLVEEVRVFRRGHALAIPAPGQLARAEQASKAHGRIIFAHSDSRGDVSSFPGALRAAKRAVEALRRLG